MKPGRELNILVAEKVLGYSRAVVIPEHIRVSSQPKRPCWLSADGEFVHILELPDFSSDIAAAWTVVEKFHHWRLEKDENGKEYEACLLYKDEEEGVFFNYFGRSDSMAHAICLAALKSVGD